MVTVRNVAGDSLFGPSVLPASTPSAAVREQIDPVRGGRPCRVRLLQGARHVADGASVEQLAGPGGAAELTAIYSELVLSPLERQRCLAQLAGPAANPATVALYTFAQFSPEARADKEVALEAVRRHTLSLEHAHRALRADRELLLEAVRRDGYSLACAHASLRADRELVLEAVCNNGYALQFAARELRADREVVRSAVQTHGCALQFASAELRSDHEVAALAVRNHATAASFAGVLVEPGPAEPTCGAEGERDALTACSSSTFDPDEKESQEGAPGVSAVMERVQGIERELGLSAAAPTATGPRSALLFPSAATKVPIRFASSPLRDAKADPIAAVCARPDVLPGPAATAMPMTPRATSRAISTSITAPPAQARSAPTYSPGRARPSSAGRAQVLPVRFPPRSAACSSPRAFRGTAVAPKEPQTAKRGQVMCIGRIAPSHICLVRAGR